MSGLNEKSVDSASIYGAAFAEVSSPIFTQNEQGFDTCWLNSFAKAVSGVASVTFEVCARPLHIRGKSNI